MLQPSGKLTAEGKNSDLINIFLSIFLLALSFPAKNLHSFPHTSYICFFIFLLHLQLKKKKPLFFFFPSLSFFPLCCLNPQRPITCGRVAFTLELLAP